MKFFILINEDEQFVLQFYEVYEKLAGEDSSWLLYDLVKSVLLHHKQYNSLLIFVVLD